MAMMVVARKREENSIKIGKNKASLLMDFSVIPTADGLVQRYGKKGKKERKKGQGFLPWFRWVFAFDF